MMDYPLLDFVLASLLMGAGIGTDVAVATATRVNQLRTTKVAVLWILGVSFTHTLFPMIGYLLTYFSIQLAPHLTPMVGIIAFVCIAVYLYAEFRDLGTANDEHPDRQILITLGLILAVSWDALWSGPAKSAQVIGWPEFLVWLSFIVVGGLVSLFALSSFAIALKVKQRLSTWTMGSSLGLWVQYSVIAYFGLLALFRYTLGWELEWYGILIVAAAAVACVILLITSRREHVHNTMSQTGL